MKRKMIVGILPAIGLIGMALLHHQPYPAWAHGWKAPAEAAKVANPIKMDSQSIQMGQRVHTQFCAGCHGPTGRGDGPLAPTMDPRPADLVARAKHHTDGDFFWKIVNGRPPMPGFKDKLSDRLIWHSINYIRSQGN